MVKYSEKILKMFDEEFKIDSQYLPIKSGIGISIYPDHGDNIAELILKADSAMYISKQNKLDYVVYSNETAKEFL